MPHSQAIRPIRRPRVAASIAVLLGVVLLAGAVARAQDTWDATLWSGAEPTVFGGADDSMLSMQRKAVIRLGGEAFVDLSYKTRDAAPAVNPANGLAELPNGRMTRTGFEATTANLRFQIEPSAASNVKLHLKLNLADAWNRNGQLDQDDILEECRFVFENIRGSGWSLMFGKGEVPFGQDRTLGIIQSYAHNADAYLSSEGMSSLLADPDWYAGVDGRPVGKDGVRDRFPHPGEIDRAFFAGASYRWADRIQAEFAVFQHDRSFDGRRTSDAMQSLAARVWWTPVEDLTFQLSGLRRHSDALGRAANRPDLADPGDATDAEYALSVGVEWTPGPFETWAEYIHGWRWNNTRGYSTDMLSVGARWHFAPGWSVGAMGEWLRLRDPRNAMRREDYYKLVASLKYEMDNGLFVIGEAGHEWFRGRYTDRQAQRADAMLFALRLGWRF